ncbi:MAG: MmgE/PrpD family protein [Angelakisella sp.]
MEPTIIEGLAGFAAGLKFEDLPPEVVSKANDCFFDLVGCYYGALKRDNNPTIVKEIASFNPAEEVTIWGTGKKCGIAEAALAMGTLSYHLEYDDGISVAGHWGSASIPATFLSVQKHGGNGKALLTAIVTAYEVSTRISRMFSPRLLKNHIHFPCTMGAFAAVAGYAKGANLGSSTLTGALSLAGLFPVGAYSTATSGAQGKGLYSGWPNYLGVNAVRLSQMGLTGDRDLMEHPDGFGNAVGLSAADDKLKEQALSKLGEEFRFMEVYFKPYPCCRWLHAPIHAVLHLMRENGVTREDIDKITILGPEFAMMYNTRENYESKVTCQYSIPYSVGAAVHYGQLGLEEYDLPARTNADLLAFIDRIDMEVDAELQSQFPAVFAVKLQLQLKDGRVLEATEGTPWGPSNPPTKQELMEKFALVTKGVLTPEEVAQWNELYSGGFEQEGAFDKAAALLGIKK